MCNTSSNPAVNNNLSNCGGCPNNAGRHSPAAFRINMDLPKYCDSGGIQYEKKSTSNGYAQENLAQTPGGHFLSNESAPAADGAARAECKPLQNGGSCQSTTAGQHMGCARSVDAHGDSGRSSNLKDHQTLYDPSPDGSGYAAWDEEVDLSEVRPRLQSKFYEELRQKYPNAFKRRGSLLSDTASLNDMPPYRPKDGFSRSNSTSHGYIPKFVRNRARNGSDPQMSNSVPSSPVPAPRLSKLRAAAQKRASVGSACDSGTRTLSSENSDKENYGSSGEWILRDANHSRGRSASSPALSLKSNNSIVRQDSSKVKERLRRNSETLKKLLSENPFRSKTSTSQHNGESPRSSVGTPRSVKSQQVYENCSPHELESSLAAVQIRAFILRARDESGEDGDQSEATVGAMQRQDSGDSLPARRSSEVTSLPPKTTPRRNREDRSGPKAIAGKRFSSPDSNNDSAIETGSLHSSPTLDPQARLKQRILNGATKVDTDGQEVQSPVLPPGCRTPKLGRARKSPPGQIYTNLSEVASQNESNSSKDSDQDSGISQPTIRHRRHDSESSADAEHDDDRRSHVNGKGRRDFRVSHQRRSSGDKTGPLRGDHSLHCQPPQQLESVSDTEVEEWMQKGMDALRHSNASQSQQRRAVSAQPHGHGADMGGAKVRFQEDLYQNIPFERAVSQPALNQTQAALPGWMADPLNESTDSEASSRGSQERQRHRYSKGAPQSNLRHTSSELVLCKKGLIHFNPADFDTRSLGIGDESMEELKDPVIQDIENAIRKSRCSTPCDVVYADCIDPDKPELDHYQASPVIVLPPRGKLSDTDQSSSSDLQTAHEFAYNSKLYDDIHSAKIKTSKKPWKKKKGSYTPQEGLTKGYVNSCQEEAIATRVLLSNPDITASKPPRAPRPVLKKASTLPSENGAVLTKMSPRPGMDDQRRSTIGTTSEHIYEDLERHARDVLHRPPPAYDMKKAENGVYASVKKTSRVPVRSASYDQTYFDDGNLDVEGPPLPYRGYNGDYTDLSDSGFSRLSRGMDGLRDSARKKWKQLRRAVSLERIDNVLQQGPLKKSPSLKSLAERLSFRKKGRRESVGSYSLSGSNGRAKRPSSAPHSGRSMNRYSSSMTALDTAGKSQCQAIGKLRQLNPDGTQLIDLHKPPHGPYGFFIARGSAKYQHGVFISRLSEGLPEDFFAGLLNVGDEIIEINGIPLKSMTLDTVYDLMAERTKLTVKTLPYMMREQLKDT